MGPVSTNGDLSWDVSRPGRRENKKRTGSHGLVEMVDLPIKNGDVP